MLDEAAERRAFQEAVAEWRRGPSTTNAISATATASAAKPSASNAKSAPINDSDEEVVTAAAAAGSERRMNAGGTSSRGGGAGTLGSGALDEAKEHAVRLYATIY